MIKKSLLISFMITSIFADTISFNAPTINSIVNETFDKNYNLKVLDSSIKSAKEQILLSSKWKNPTLSFGATDIQFDDITRRDLEPMQAYFVGVSQVVPLGNKLDIEKKIALNDYEISKYSLEDQKLQYKSKIYEYIYNIKLLEERISLFEEFKKNTKKLEKLLTQLYEYNKATQVEILNTQIIYQELNLKSQDLKTILNTTILRLKQITYQDYKNIDIDTNIREIKLNTNIKSHPKILSLIQNSKKFNNISYLEKEKKNSDINVSLSYFKRDDRFEDYVNLAFSIPLSIYGSEDIKSRQAKFKTSEIKNNLNNQEHSFKNQIKTYQQNIDDAIKTLNIINKKIIPKINQLEKILKTYNSFSSSSNIDSKSLINNFNQIINYKLKAVEQKEKYFNAIAKSIYIIKEI